MTHSKQKLSFSSAMLFAHYFSLDDTIAEYHITIFAHSRMDAQAIMSVLFLYYRIDTP